MKKWAEKEIELAIENEIKNCKKDGDSFGDYGVNCYKSALKAFNSLLEDNHSGFSIMLTKNILNRLIEGKPLIPITEDDEFKYLTIKPDGSIVYQCNRMSSLFKIIHPDKNIGIVYDDVERVVCYEIDKGCSYISGYVTDIINDLHPISLPYSGEKYNVFVDSFIVLEDGKEISCEEILYYINPQGDKIIMNKYFKEIDNMMKEITFEEFIPLSKKRIIEQR